MTKAKFLKVDSERNYGEGYNRWVRCRHCGMLNDITTRNTGEGLGYTVKAVTTSGETGYEQIVHAGCAFCGSKNGW